MAIVSNFDMKRFGKSILWTVTALLFTATSLAQTEEDANEESLFHQFQEFKTADEKMTFFFNAEDLYRENSTYDWLELVTLNLNAAIKNNDKEDIKKFQLMQARIFYDLGDYDKSLAITKDLYEEIEDLDIYLVSKLLDLMDDNYGQLTMYPEQIDIREKKRDMGIMESVAFYDIYSNLGMYRKAMDDYIANVKRTIEENDFYGQAEYYNNLGNYLRLDGSTPTALSYYKKAKGFADVFLDNVTRKKSENVLREAFLLKGVIEGNIGKCHVDLKEYEQAIPYLEAAINRIKENSNNNREYASEITENSLAISECYLLLKNYAKATDYLSDNLQTNTTENLLKKNRLLALYYEMTEDYKSSASYLRKEIRIRDSISEHESQLRQQQLSTVMMKNLKYSQDMLAEQKLALEKQRNENLAKDKRNSLVLISLLFTLLGFAGLVYAYLKSIKNQRLIAEQKYIIENSLVEKDSLLKEIHHRVKNNLQMVSSLLSLQTKNTRSKAAIEALEEGKSRVKAMALIHQKLYQNEDLSVIEMQSYIESLINSVQSVYKKGGHNINITVDAEGVELDIDRAIPFGLILNELVSNSFKYAFPHGDENGKIYIHLRKNGEHEGYFEYSDNGVGLPEDTEERANTSMGIRLMNRLANQLQTTLNIDKNGDEGVRYWFSFK
ncbi:Two-component sensor histidine kinase, contains HisKA and HATPase domains [Pseudozobellia thermophila]|uniref:histidine kinase n=2 Tax=Pseudozobellia thermophila TaxID=192903 RepID=A0A1M6LD62_9FLAO|nr:Two-component sensor histidine kinase, contains HisKA and HATPase domains [Pseudozobellia thermophila]